MCGNKRRKAWSVLHSLDCFYSGNNASNEKHEAQHGGEDESCHLRHIHGLTTSRGFSWGQDHVVSADASSLVPETENRAWNPKRPEYSSGFKLS